MAVERQRPLLPRFGSWEDAPDSDAQSFSGQFGNVCVARFGRQFTERHESAEQSLYQLPPITKYVPPAPLPIEQKEWGYPGGPPHPPHINTSRDSNKWRHVPVNVSRGMHGMKPPPVTHRPPFSPDSSPENSPRHSPPSPTFLNSPLTPKSHLPSPPKSGKKLDAQVMAAPGFSVKSPSSSQATSPTVMSPGSTQSSPSQFATSRQLEQLQGTRSPVLGGNNGNFSGVLRSPPAASSQGAVPISNAIAAAAIGVSPLAVLPSHIATAVPALPHIVSRPQEDSSGASFVRSPASTPRTPGSARVPRFGNWEHAEQPGSSPEAEFTKRFTKLSQEKRSGLDYSTSSPRSMDSGLPWANTSATFSMKSGPLDRGLLLATLPTAGAAAAARLPTPPQGDSSTGAGPSVRADPSTTGGQEAPAKAIAASTKPGPQPSAVSPRSAGKFWGLGASRKSKPPGKERVSSLSNDSAKPATKASAQAPGESVGKGEAAASGSGAGAAQSSSLQALPQSMQLLPLSVAAPHGDIIPPFANAAAQKSALPPRPELIPKTANAKVEPLPAPYIVEVVAASRMVSSKPEMRKASSGKKLAGLRQGPQPPSPSSAGCCLSPQVQD